MGLPLTRYGLREMAAATAVLGALAVVGWLLWPPAAALPAAIWLAVLLFFRDPPRRPDADGAFISAADGRVADITPLRPDGPLGCEGTQIGVFMSVLDAHVNRAPFEGRVVSVTHRDGGYLDARNPDATELNESTTILFSCPDGAGGEFPLVVRQIAGLVARRIVTDLRPGRQVRTAERFGMVKFGSRVEVQIPAGRFGEVAVKVGQTVRAGKTVIAWPLKSDI